MQPEQGINRELTFGEIFSKTFDLFRRDFGKYFVLFAVVEVVINVLNALLSHVFVIHTLPSSPTAQQVVSYFGAFAPLALLTFVLTIVFFPIAQGSAIKMASEQVETGKTDLGAMVRFTASKLLSIWALSIIVGIIVVLGFIALIIPGIILAIMFALSFPVLLIEGKGVLDSMSRSRALVSNRWLKTFAVFLVLAIIVGIASAIASLISGVFGIASPVVSGLLAGLYDPLFPILLAVYFYSNRARLAQSQMPPPSPPPPAPAAGGVKYCPKCGTQLAANAAFCPSCGAKQSV
jgi:hypothetical protein